MEAKPPKTFATNTKKIPKPCKTFPEIDANISTTEFPSLLTQIRQTPPKIFFFFVPGKKYPEAPWIARLWNASPHQSGRSHLLPAPRPLIRGRSLLPGEGRFLYSFEPFFLFFFIIPNPSILSPGISSPQSFLGFIRIGIFTFFMREIPIVRYLYFIRAFLVMFYPA